MNHDTMNPFGGVARKILGRSGKTGTKEDSEAKRSGFHLAGFHCLPMKLVRFGKLLTLITFFGLSIGAGAQALPTLKVVVQDEILSFQLDVEQGKDSWILQHSSDGERWEDVIFLVKLSLEEDLEIEIARKILPGGVAKAGFFRAAKILGDDPLYRRFLESWVKWKTADLSSYSYRVSLSQGGLSSDVRYTVVDGEVASFEVIEIFPDIISPAEDTTIDDFFEKIRRARDQGAVIIDVTWDQDLGFPTTGYIDLDERLADEEQGWTISEVTPRN
jgi:hypothetical protein